MRITFSPQLRGDAIELSVSGDVLTINGEAFDFSSLPDGGSLPAEAIDSMWIRGNVERINGALLVTVMLPIRADATEAERFPQNIVDPPDGPIALPGQE